MSSIGRKDFTRIKLVSLWNDQEKTRRKKLPHLKGRRKTDVVIIGGGITGLSAAYFLKKNGSKFMLLEKDRIGGAASGNNSGILWPGYIPYITDLIHKFDYGLARDLYQKSHDYLELLKGIIKKEKISCEFGQNGVIALMKMNAKREKKFKEEAKFSTKMGIPLVYSARKPVKMESSQRYNRYLYCPAGVTINSGKLLTFLMKKVQPHIFEQSRVERIDFIRTRKEYEVWTQDGVIYANKVILATNAYALQGIASDFGLTRSIGRLAEIKKARVFASFCLATRPLAASEIKAYASVAKPPAFYTGDSFYYYGKLTEDRRLIFGGLDKFKRKHTRTFSIVDHHHFLKDLFAAIRRVLPKMDFLEPKDIEYFWGGYDVETSLSIPITIELSPGLCFGGFYDGLGALNGFGIGRTLAEMVS